MRKIQEIKANFKPIYPIWLLKILFVEDYNKNISFIGLKTSGRRLLIFSLIFITLLMILSYELNGNEPTLFVWFGVSVYVIMFLSVISLILFTIYNNIRIRKICNKYGFTLEEWNNS